MFGLNASISSHKVPLASNSMPEAHTLRMHACRKYHAWILEPSGLGLLWILWNITCFWWGVHSSGPCHTVQWIMSIVPFHTRSLCNHGYNREVFQHVKHEYIYSWLRIPMWHQNMWAFWDVLWVVAHHNFSKPSSICNANVMCLWITCSKTSIIFDIFNCLLWSMWK